MVTRPNVIPQVDGLSANLVNQIVRLGEYTYWPYTTSSNDLKLIVVAFDSNNQEVKRWEVPGYRYAIDIGIDNQNKTVVFYMWQRVGNYPTGSYPVTFGWDQLQID
ncbi:hypothetical protein ACFVS2_10245 [Brevibacillus sp. NPDC058079]|uniref:hypothetical protein n=1 Tax=Brevibacillus sp. NPDC058079 TaxID=3346330 RepID=UPI0036E93047